MCEFFLHLYAVPFAFVCSFWTNPPLDAALSSKPRAILYRLPTVPVTYSPCGPSLRFCLSGARSILVTVMDNFAPLSFSLTVSSPLLRAAMRLVYHSESPSFLLVSYPLSVHVFVLRGPPRFFVRFTSASEF